MNKPARIDVLNVANLEHALCINGQRIMTANNSQPESRRELQELAVKMEGQLGLERHMSYIRTNLNKPWPAIVDEYFRIEADKPDADLFETIALNREIDTAALDELSSGLKGALTRSVNRITSLKDEVMGKYLSSGLATLTGVIAQYGGGTDNPILADYMNEISMGTVAAGAMTAYGVGVLAAGKAHQFLVQNVPAYQDKVNERFLHKIEMTMLEEGVDSPSRLTPKNKASLLDALRLSYPQADADVLDTFCGLQEMREQEAVLAHGKDNAYDNDTMAPLKR